MSVHPMTNGAAAAATSVSVPDSLSAGGGDASGKSFGAMFGGVHYDRKTAWDYAFMIWAVAWSFFDGLYLMYTLGSCDGGGAGSCKKGWFLACMIAANVIQIIVFVFSVWTEPGSPLALVWCRLTVACGILANVAIFTLSPYGPFGTYGLVLTIGLSYMTYFARMAFPPPAPDQSPLTRDQFLYILQNSFGCLSLFGDFALAINIVRDSNRSRLDFIIAILLFVCSAPHGASSDLTVCIPYPTPDVVKLRTRLSVVAKLPILALNTILMTRAITASDGADSFGLALPCVAFALSVCSLIYNTALLCNLWCYPPSQSRAAAGVASVGGSAVALSSATVVVVAPAPAPDP